MRCQAIAGVSEVSPASKSGPLAVMITFVTVAEPGHPLASP